MDSIKKFPWSSPTVAKRGQGLAAMAPWAGNDPVGP